MCARTQELPGSFPPSVVLEHSAAGDKDLSTACTMSATASW
jgi:hypothetical protein